MKIVILSNYYAPESATVIPVGLAHELVQRGHQVTVVTAFPSYPQGRLYAGYRQRAVETGRDGDIRVIRVGTFISHSLNPVTRVLTYLSFGFASAIHGAKAARGADVVFAYATPMTAAIGASVWRRLFRVPFVLSVQDLWPESVTGSALLSGSLAGRIASTVLGPWLRGLYRTAAATTAISPRMLTALVERGVPREKAHMIFNWAIEDGKQPGAAAEATTPGLTVMYAGNLGGMQDLTTVVRAAALVRDLPGMRVVFVGAGAMEAELRRLASSEKATNVEFRGFQSQQDLPAHLAESDFQLVTLKNLGIFESTIPSKFQASLYIGKPVISTVAGTVADIVRTESLGIACAAENPEDLADAFRRAYAMSPSDRRAMGDRARTYYTTTMSRTRGVDQIEAVLTQIVAGKKESRNT
jgi:colanic acid biosynthesis glycosyl transferase WcaI